MIDIQTFNNIETAKFICKNKQKELFDFNIYGHLTFSLEIYFFETDVAFSFYCDSAKFPNKQFLFYRYTLDRKQYKELFYNKCKDIYIYIHKKFNLIKKDIIEFINWHPEMVQYKNLKVVWCFEKQDLHIEYLLDELYSSVKYSLAFRTLDKKTLERLFKGEMTKLEMLNSLTLVDQYLDQISEYFYYDSDPSNPSNYDPNNDDNYDSDLSDDDDKYVLYYKIFKNIDIRNLFGYTIQNKTIIYDFVYEYYYMPYDYYFFKDWKKKAENVEFVKMLKQKRDDDDDDFLRNSDNKLFLNNLKGEREENFIKYLEEEFIRQLEEEGKVELVKTLKQKRDDDDFFLKLFLYYIYILIIIILTILKP
jgi:hypothetical protein